MAYKTNLIEFISREENDLLTTTANFREDFDRFSKVDGHLQAPGDYLSVPASDQHGRTIHKYSGGQLKVVAESCNGYITE